MRISVRTAPQKHIVVDDFVTPEEREELLREFQSLQQALGAGTVLRQGVELTSAKKQNKNLWLDVHYAGRRQDSLALRLFKDRFWSQPIKDAMRETGDLLFANAVHANADCVLLSVYGPGSYYGQHHDQYPSIGGNLMISSVPKRFRGGDFYLGDDSVFDPGRPTAFSRVDFVPGRLVIFPTRAMHYVDLVQADDLAFVDGRFSVQYWPQFTTQP
jgi:hypothetical protein